MLLSYLTLLLLQHHTPSYTLLYTLQSQDIEALLKQWATTFDISDHDLNQRLNDATTGELQRPPDR